MANRSKKKRPAQVQKKQNNNSEETKFTWSKFWNYMGFASTVIAIVTGVFFAKDRWFKSEQEKLNEIEETHSIEGEVKAPKIFAKKIEYHNLDRPFFFNTKTANIKSKKIIGLKIRYYHENEMVVFVFGPLDYVMVPIKALLSGVIINVHKYSGCDDVQFKFGIHSERLYVSTEFKDLQQERTVGIIEYNHWRIFRDNYGTIHNDNDGFEVTDRQHYLIFTMKYELNTLKDSTNVISIGGYFISPSSIRIIQNYAGGRGTYQDTCFSKKVLDWKIKSEINISHIKSNFP